MPFIIFRNEKVKLINEKSQKLFGLKIQNFNTKKMKK